MQEGTQTEKADSKNVGASYIYFGVVYSAWKLQVFLALAQSIAHSDDLQSVNH